MTPYMQVAYDYAGWLRIYSELMAISWLKTRANKNPTNIGNCGLSPLCSARGDVSFRADEGNGWTPRTTAFHPCRCPRDSIFLSSVLGSDRYLHEKETKRRRVHKYDRIQKKASAVVTKVTTSNIAQHDVKRVNFSRMSRFRVRTLFPTRNRFHYIPLKRSL